MQWLRTVVLSALAVLWLPVTMHCQLESLTGFEILACCTHPDKAPHQDNDCNEDGCADVESGLYFCEDHQVETVAPLLRTVELLSSETEITSVPVIRPLCLEAAPPEIFTAWQFSLRAALSPRAPSVLS